MTEPDDDLQSVPCVLNGVTARLVGRPAMPASVALRAHGVFSVREACGLGVCGSCTVLLDGEPVSTCITPLYALDGRDVRTAEGLERDGELSDLQQQFVESQAFQCSFCTPGFLLSGTALLDRTSGELDDEAIEEGLQGHLCRCGCYDSIKEAVRTCAARRLQ
jgi:aerobic-type carbon monoxide dehydrogenase small subunit (CoxS/CutS family)